VAATSLALTQAGSGASEAAGHSPVGLYAAAREAGRQIVRDGVFQRHTLDAVADEIVAFEDYVHQLQESFRHALDGPGTAEA
jgi:hypothetical protein